MWRRNCAIEKKEQRTAQVLSANFTVQSSNATRRPASPSGSLPNQVCPLDIQAISKCLAAQCASPGMRTFFMQQLRCKKNHRFFAPLWTEETLRAAFLFVFFDHHVIWGWEHEVQIQAPGSGVSSGRCVAAPCAWWRALCDGTAAPPGTPWVGRRWR